MINIKMTDGTPLSLWVTTEDGKEITGITAIDIRLRPDELAQATLEIYVKDLDLSLLPDGVVVNCIDEDVDEESES